MQNVCLLTPRVWAFPRLRSVLRKHHVTGWGYPKAPLSWSFPEMEKMTAEILGVLSEVVVTYSMPVQS